jgi:5-methylcytosine-specific restriction endonuclease McrA
LKGAPARLFIDNKYTNWYYEIIHNAQNRITTGYIEKHHIIPRSLGGSNELSNIVRLTAREHYICHYLLTKMTTSKDKIKMFHALRFLNANNKKVLEYMSTLRLIYF